MDDTPSTVPSQLSECEVFSSLLKSWIQTQRQCSRIHSFPWWTKHVLKHAQLCCTESEAQLGQNTTLYKSRLSAHAFYVFDECRFHTCMLTYNSMLDVQLSGYIIISFPAYTQCCSTRFVLVRHLMRKSRDNHHCH